ncbi:MAG: hypothetical protein JWM44_724 [Bacilli bacterium]|nr:hypothetical protein [Bacilli bacterium]
MSLVKLWESIFKALKWISLFQIVMTLFAKKLKGKHAFVDVWVFTHFILSFLGLCLVQANVSHVLDVIILTYGFLRVFEIFVYQVNLIFFPLKSTRASIKIPPVIKKRPGLKSYRRTNILLLHNFVEIIFWFAIYYFLNPQIFTLDKLHPLTLFQSINTSFVTMTTFGTINFAIKSSGDKVFLIQSIFGLFMTLIIIARFISLLPQPGSMDKDEQA